MKKAEVSLFRKGLVVAPQRTKDGRRHTIRSSECGVDNFPSPPSLVYTEPELIERNVGDRGSFRSWGPPQIFPSDTNKDVRTGLQSKMNREVHPEDELCSSYEKQGGGNPPIVPRDGIYPRCTMSDSRRMDSKWERTSM